MVCLSSRSNVQPSVLNLQVTILSFLLCYFHFVLFVWREFCLLLASLHLSLSIQLDVIWQLMHSWKCSTCMFFKNWNSLKKYLTELNFLCYIRIFYIIVSSIILCHNILIVLDNCQLKLCSFVEYLMLCNGSISISLAPTVEFVLLNFHSICQTTTSQQWGSFSIEINSKDWYFKYLRRSHLIS